MKPVFLLVVFWAFVVLFSVSIFLLKPSLELMEGLLIFFSMCGLLTSVVCFHYENKVGSETRKVLDNTITLISKEIEKRNKKNEQPES
jgi:hypothetical protein